jgi:hypothetical protein
MTIWFVFGIYLFGVFTGFLVIGILMMLYASDGGTIIFKQETNEK